MDRGCGADGSDQDRNNHGSGQALAAYVADDDEHASAAVGDLLEEVAAELVGGLVDALHVKPGALVEMIGQEHLLHLPCGFKFGSEMFFSLTSAREAADEKDQHGQQKDEIKDK